MVEGIKNIAMYWVKAVWFFRQRVCAWIRLFVFNFRLSFRLVK